MSALLKARLLEKRRVSVVHLLESDLVSAEDKAVVRRKYRLYQAMTGLSAISLMGGVAALIKRRWPAPSRYMLKELATCVVFSVAFQFLRLTYISLLWSGTRETVRKYALQEQESLQRVMSRRGKMVEEQN